MPDPVSLAAGGCACLEAHACRIFALGQTQNSQAHGEPAGRIHAEVAMALAPGDFYKSMTTHADHRIWQDVYRPMTAAGRVYLKLTVIDDVLIVSFKEI